MNDRPSDVILATASASEPIATHVRVAEHLAKAFSVSVRSITVASDSNSHASGGGTHVKGASETAIAKAIVASTPPTALLVIGSSHANRWEGTRSIAEYAVDDHAGPSCVIGAHSLSDAPDDPALDSPALGGPVLVALDGTDAAASALPFAAELAGRCETDLVLCRIVPEALHPSRTSDDPDIAPSHDQTWLEVRSSLEARAEVMTSDVSTTSSVLASNDPIAALAAHAARVNASLIVLASRGDRSTRRASISRTASGLIAEATCPVIVVHPSS